MPPTPSTLTSSPDNMAIRRTKGQYVPLFSLISADFISDLGNVLSLVAIPWFVLQTTGSATQTGLTALCSTLPMIISAIFGSAFVDRLGYRRSAILSDLTSGCFVMLIPLLYHTIGLAFWQLLTLVFISNLLRMPGDTARYTMLPLVAERAGISIERATTIAEGGQRIARMIGMPLGAILIPIIGTSNVLWLDAASFFISLALIFIGIPRHLQTINKETDNTSTSYLTHLVEGFQYLRKDNLLLALICTILVTNALDAALSSVIAPAYMQKIFGSPLPLGINSAVFSGCTLVSIIIYAMIGHRLPRRWTLGISFTIGGAMRFWVLLIPLIPVYVIVHALAGLAIGPINPICMAILYERTPENMRARVLGLLSAGVLLGMPFGQFASGYAADWIGLEASLIIMGAIYLIATLSILVNPALRTMEADKAKRDVNHLDTSASNPIVEPTSTASRS